MKQMRKPTWALIAVFVGLLLMCGTIAVISAVRATGGPQQVEIEDCDAEDWRNYDPECGRISPRPAVSKAPSKAPVRTPAARGSR